LRPVVSSRNTLVIITHASWRIAQPCGQLTAVSYPVQPLYTPFTVKLLIPVRGLLPLELTPGLLSLLAGKPNPTTFPIEQLTITLRSPTAPQPYQPGDPISETITLKNDDISTALQYSLTDGVPELREVLGEFQLTEHGVVVDEVKYQLAMGNGSQDLLYKAFTAVLDPGDAILVEAPVYA
jgi:tryptophan aminotransferase